MGIIHLNVLESEVYDLLQSIHCPSETRFFTTGNANPVVMGFFSYFPREMGQDFIRKQNPIGRIQALSIGSSLLLDPLLQNKYPISADRIRSAMMEFAYVR